MQPMVALLPIPGGRQSQETLEQYEKLIEDAIGKVARGTGVDSSKCNLHTCIFRRGLARSRHKLRITCVRSADRATVTRR